MSMNKDYSGQRFGRITVVRYLEENEREFVNRRWLCKCDCGTIKQINIANLTSGNIRSCGCLQRERMAKLNFKHGKWKTKLFNVWIAMRNRCYQKNTKYYINYGGRGVTMCPEWKDDFNNFEKWALANGYQDGLSIDRIDVNGNYEPSNCRWATLKQQANNTRRNHYLTFEGKTQSLQMWADETGISYSAIKTRVAKGWSAKDTLTVPNLQRGQRLYGRGKNM